MWFNGHIKNNSSASYYAWLITNDTFSQSSKRSSIQGQINPFEPSQVLHHHQPKETHGATNRFIQHQAAEKAVDHHTKAEPSFPGVRKVMSLSQQSSRHTLCNTRIKSLPSRAYWTRKLEQRFHQTSPRALTHPCGRRRVSSSKVTAK